jgi:hypothetical protein
VGWLRTKDSAGGTPTDATGTVALPEKVANDRGYMKKAEICGARLCSEERSDAEPGVAASEVRHTNVLRLVFDTAALRLIAACVTHF